MELQRYGIAMVVSAVGKFRRSRWVVALSQSRIAFQRSI